VQALQLAERAAALTGRRDVAALDALAAAYAATGRFDEAIATAQAALDSAVASGQGDVAAQLRERWWCIKSANRTELRDNGDRADPISRDPTFRNDRLRICHQMHFPHGIRLVTTVASNQSKSVGPYD
jgi:hypothetical protein